MNILCYTNKMNNGGAERVMSILVNELHNRGHEVILVNDYQYPNDYFIEPEVEHYYIDGSYNQKDGNAWRRNFRRIKFLRNICKTHKIDVVLSFISDANFRAILSTIGLKTKNVISVRVDPATAYKSRKRALLAKLFYSHAEGCVFQTQQAKEWYSQRIQKHSTVILNPVYNAFYDVENSPGKEKRIVSSGRLSTQKRFDVLIDAYSKIHSLFPEYTLEIYGEGEEKEPLQKQINKLNLQNSAFLRGRSEKIYEDIKNAAIYVLSSDFEGLPNSLMEAMVLGLPCVSTDFSGGGARAIIDNGIDGFIVPCGDGDAIAEKVMEIIKDQNVAHQLSDNAYKKGKHFATQEVVDSWEQYLKRMIEEKS